MNLHEFQAKDLLRRFGIPIPDFGVASTPKEVERVVAELGLQQAVVKIQVHAGGRGKAGGVKIAHSRAEIADLAAALIGMKMVNRQTGPEGVVAQKVLITRPVEIEKEFYLSVLVDRKLGRPVLIASPQGGMDIEEVAHTAPEQIVTLPIGEKGVLRAYQKLRLVKCMGWQGEIAVQGLRIAEGLIRCFLETDGALVEINPLVATPQGDLLAIDAKYAIDDNALFRHKDLAAWFDPTQISSQEARAKAEDLSYVAMHGNIGCMVNGAGLAMATMDMIQLVGGAPANFLDVGGSATQEKISFGFQLIVSDPKVKAIFINIFGGIMDCGKLAAGVVGAVKAEHVTVPIIVRMEGTNVQEGKRIFQESGIAISLVETLAMGAQEAVKSCLQRG